MSLDDRLRQWNREISDMEWRAHELRVSAVRRKRGIGRSTLLFLARIYERLAAMGKRWRNDDIFGDD